MKAYEVILDEDSRHTQVYVHDGRSLAGRTFACAYLRLLVNELHDMRYYRHSDSSAFAAVRIIAERLANFTEADVDILGSVVGMYAHSKFVPVLQMVQHEVLSNVPGDFYRLQLESAFHYISDYREEYLLAS